MTSCDTNNWCGGACDCQHSKLAWRRYALATSDRVVTHALTKLVAS